MKQIILLSILIYPSLSFSNDMATRYLRFVIDKEYGCQYVLTDDQILPRVGIDGKIICEKNKQNNSFLQAVIVTDVVTGCKYITNFESRGLTYRLKENRTVDCSNR